VLNEYLLKSGSNFMGVSKFWGTMSKEVKKTVATEDLNAVSISAWLLHVLSELSQGAMANTSLLSVYSSISISRSSGWLAERQ